MSVIACIVPLFWTVLFVYLITFFFTLIILQGITAELNHEHDPALVEPFRTHFGGFSKCFKTLFITVVGNSWVEAHDWLSEMGFIQSMLLPLFVIVVNVGIMNIMIGVFAAAASGWNDVDIIAQDEIFRLEDFVESMLATFERIAPRGATSIDKDSFKAFFRREQVQAYLASQDLDSGHAELIYKLCDRNGDGEVDIREFVLAMMTHKGGSKMLDSKVMMHAIGAIAEDIDLLRQELAQTRPTSTEVHHM